MSSATQDPTLALPPAARGIAFSTNWIIDPWSDLLLIIGPVVVGYAFLYMNVALGISSLLIWWFWEVSLNGSHFFATLSRTYFDRQEWRERSGLLLGSLLWIGLGPLTLILDEDFETSLPSYLFFFFQLGWAYFHVVRQHYGLFCIYQKKNQEISGSRNKTEYWLFNVVMFGPFVVWMLRSPAYRSMLHIPAIENVNQWLIWPLEGIVLSAFVVYLGKAIVDARQTGKFNVPKTAFLSAYFSLHAVTAFCLSAQYAFDILLLNAVLTYPHNIQYMTIVWHYNKKHYQQSKGDFGAASFINRSAFRFLFFGSVFGILFFYTWWYFAGTYVPYLSFVSSLAGMPLYGHTVGQFVGMIALGIIFNHYYLDQQIWRVNRDAKVARELGVVPPSPP
jgi:hypothetical protein